MDLSAASALTLLNSGELEDIIQIRRVSPLYRLQAAQVLASEHDDFFYSPNLQDAVTAALVDLVKELASSFDGDASENEALIVQNVVSHYFEMRARYFTEHDADWPQESIKSVKKSFPWPVVQLPENSGRTKVGSFGNEFSALKMFGYTVGKTSGWPQKQRQEFLSDFMSLQLPEVVERLFGSEYGQPMSVERLRKLADLISALCKLAMRRDPVVLEVAISDWKDDLDFLRKKYYEGLGLKFVPWPHAKL
jgi:hypothetical protein